MKVLLSGGSGQLGHALQQQQPAGVLLTAPTSAQLNLCDKAQLIHCIQRLRPHWVINAAAFTDVEQAEKNSGQAFAVNATGTGHLAQVLAAMEIPLLHLSSDYVFSGTLRRAYREDDAPEPLNRYGQSKLCGERLLAACHPRHIILRSSWLFGVQGHNFVKTIVRKGQNGERLAVVDDQFGSPTSASGLASAIWRIMEHAPKAAQSPWGIYHFAGAPACSWHAFATVIVQQALEVGLLKQPCTVLPIKTPQHPSAARRPPCSALDSRRLQQRFGIEADDWRASLRQVLQGLKRTPAWDPLKNRFFVPSSMENTGTHQGG